MLYYIEYIVVKTIIKLFKSTNYCNGIELFLIKIKLQILINNIKKYYYWFLFFILSFFKR